MIDQKNLVLGMQKKKIRRQKRKKEEEKRNCHKTADTRRKREDKGRGKHREKRQSHVLLCLPDQVVLENDWFAMRAKSHLLLDIKLLNGELAGRARTAYHPSTVTTVVLQ